VRTIPPVRSGREGRLSFAEEDPAVAPGGWVAGEHGVEAVVADRLTNQENA